MKIVHAVPWLLGLALLAGSPPAGAQGAHEEPPFMRELYPPDLVMTHAGEIGLSDAQRGAITRAVQETQGIAVELRWEMVEAARALGELMSRAPVPEEEALAQASRVMELETRVKRSHLRMLIRIKNALEPAQQQQLQALRGR